MRHPVRRRPPAIVAASCLAVLLCGCAEIIHPGEARLIPYVQGQLDPTLQLVGDEEGEILLSRQGFFLTGSSWQWSGAPSFQLTPVGDGRKVHVRIKDPSGTVPVSENGFVREFDPQNQPVVVLSTGKPMQAEFTVSWKP